MRGKIKIRVKYFQNLGQREKWIDVNYHLYTWKKINSICEEDGNQPSVSPVSPLITKQKKV